MVNIFGTLMKEAFSVATPPENPPANRNSLSSILVQETFGIATPPEAPNPTTTLLVGTALLEEAGLRSPLKQATIATQPEVSTSATLEVIKQVAEKSWLEGIGMATAYTAQDIIKGAFQATEPEGPPAAEIVWQWGKKTVGQTITNIRSGLSANAAAKARAKADAETARQNTEAIAAQEKMNSARKDATTIENEFASARNRTAQSETANADAVVLAAQGARELAAIIAAMRGNDTTQSNQNGPETVDGKIIY